MRIVVIGHGMVGSRFAADIVRTDPSAQVTVLGQEDHAPYNRVMLSSLVAGTTDAGSLALEAEVCERLRVLRGVRAVSIDRDRREVADSRGELHTYDRLVLATGSAARVPEVAGLRSGDGLAGGVSALKDPTTRGGFSRPRTGPRRPWCWARGCSASRWPPASPPAGFA